MPIQILDFSVCLLCPARKMEVHHWCCVGKHEWPELLWSTPAVDELILSNSLLSTLHTQTQIIN